MAQQSRDEVRARYETNMAFRVGGKIVARYVEIGSEVKKGALLARLDVEDTRLVTQNARAQLSAAQANFNQAQTELNRYRKLFESRVISQAELDRRQNTYNTAEAQLDSARSQLRSAQNQMDYTELHADADGVITAALLPSDISEVLPTVGDTDGSAHLMSLPLREAREVFERQYLLAQIERFGGNISKTAEFVGMERSALHRKIKSLGL